MLKRLFLLIVTLLSFVMSASANDLFSSLPKDMRESYVKLAEEYYNREWNVLPDSVFARFKKDGNRIEYENMCFMRRTQFAILVMGEAMERKNRFIPDILKGLHLLIDEPWWGIPAHYNRAVPSYSVQTVDLFNAETAGMIAWTKKILGTQLEKHESGICSRIDKEIEHRILRPALGSKYWWKSASMNWNPWICSNWLACVLLCETDEQKRDQAINEIQGCMDAFIRQYPEDGGCDEGTGYWDRAAASLYECMQLLRDANVDDSKYCNNPKVRNMAAYIYKMYISNDYCVNFADAHENKSVVQLNVLYPFALYLDDEAMRQFAAYIAQSGDFYHNPAKLYAKSGNFPTLGRELRLLENYVSLKKESPKEPKVEAWLPDLQIKTMRSSLVSKREKKGKKQRALKRNGDNNSLFVAVKGGHNDESHNHNDVGSFIVYAEGKPLLIDPGVGEYTSQTFGKNRYDIWTMQSQYHNLPQVNGIDQRNGKMYAAKVVSQDSNSILLDITKAYPSEALLKSWQRKVSVKQGELEIIDEFSLSECHVPAKLMYMTTLKPDISTPGVVRLGQHTMTYPKDKWIVSVENLSERLDTILEKLWGTEMYRVVLTSASCNLEGRVDIVIK